MLQLLLWYFGPFYLWGMSIGGYKFTAIILGCSLNYAAYFAEIYRSGIESIPVGQYEAAQLLGYIENPYPLMSIADLLVCSSKYEGFSTFISEGLILGKPIVTTDCTGMKELLGECEFGLITENSESSLYEGIKKMLLNPDLCTHYARKSQERGQQLSRGQTVSDVENLFFELIN